MEKEKYNCDVTKEFCTHFMYQADHNGDACIVYCNHPDNTEDVEGNCTTELCPIYREKIPPGTYDMQRRPGGKIVIVSGAFAGREIS
jgi:hypothetical protein